MRTSVILGIKADQTPVMVSVGSGPDLDKEFRAIRRGESKCEGFVRAELWTRLKGRIKRHTFPKVAKKAAKKAAKTSYSPPPE